MKLFVGLGNPGEKYVQHRHNIGFRALETIAEIYGFAPWKKKFKGLLSEGLIGKEKVLLLKPLTYMNESGQSVGEAVRFYNLTEDDLIIFHDELDLAPGKIKVKIGGGNAGHNGLRSLSAHVGNETVRVRLGIGHPGTKDAVAHYVLSDFSKSDQIWLKDLLEATGLAAPYLAKKDLQGFMNKIGVLLSSQRISDEDKAQKKPRDQDATPSGQQKRDLSLRETLGSMLKRQKPSN